MDKLQAILENYRKLRGYCDSIWERVRMAHPEEITCRKGCATCCELQSVNHLEAHVIRSHVRARGISLSEEPRGGGHICPFLRGHACEIYDARPLICRTHGLILRSNEFPHARHAGTCPYNFPSIHPLDIAPELTVDIDNVTENFSRLNAAFCIVSGIDLRDETQSRVPLIELAPACAGNMA